MQASLEPASHYFYSDRLKLQFWDWGTEGKPVLILVHGSRDHARSWDWIAHALRDDYHVYALDLRDTAIAPGSGRPLQRAGTHPGPDRVRRYHRGIPGAADWALAGCDGVAVFLGDISGESREAGGDRGSGRGTAGVDAETASERMRNWIEKTRALEDHAARTYTNLAAAVARMKEANPFLTDEVAEHLTLHGTNWNADGSLVWKFDNYTRVIHPFGLGLEEAVQILGQITCPTLLFWGRESFARDPDVDPQAAAIRNKTIVKVDQAGHWLHHDQLGLFLRETKRFLAGNERE